jgi:hypothetical protein
LSNDLLKINAQPGACNLIYSRGIDQEDQWFQVTPGQIVGETPYLRGKKKTSQKSTGGMAQAVRECQPNKHEDLSSNSLSQKNQ